MQHKFSNKINKMTKSSSYENRITNNSLKKNNNNKQPIMQSASTINNRANLQSARAGRVVVTQVSNDVWEYENDW